MRYLIIFLLSLLNPCLALGEIHIEQARQALKNYGLSHCVLAPFNEQSALRTDIAVSADAYSFMGNGLHSILQNEDTLQVLHDRYKATRNYVYAASEQTPSISKTLEKPFRFLWVPGGLNSEAFDSFIKTQDRHVAD